MEYKKLYECAGYYKERTKDISIENYVTTENMIPDRGGVTTIDEVPSIKSAAKYEKGDILLSNIRPYFKKIWFADKNGSCSNDVLVIRSKEGYLPKFIYYVLSDNQFFTYDTITSKGTKMPRGTPAAIMKYLVPNLDVTEQGKIVHCLSSYDSLIANNNKRIKILEQMAENLYKEWFVRFRFPGYEKAEFVDGVPKDWEITTVGEVAHTLRRGISPTYDDNGSLTVISQKCIRTNIMDITEARKHVKRYNEELNLLDGDTVICSTGTGTLGRVGRIIGDYEKTTFDSHVTLVRAKEGISKLYLYAALKELQPWLVNMGIGSTNQQELYVKTIKRAKVILPEYSLMQNYDKLAYKIDKEIGLLIRMNEKLIKQRDLLLPRLMSGKLQVK